MKGPTCLVILDGFGIGNGGEGDATALAQTPFLDRAARLYPKARLETSGAAVGLPDGQMGNSEVGHMTLGAGCIIDQDIVRIQKAAERGEFAQNPVIQDIILAGGRAGGQVHLMGLISDGGVHSWPGHLDGILALLEERGVRPILHAFTDGRDTPPQSALRWIAPLEARLKASGGCIATVSGRYWAMDRDKRWERVARAFQAIVQRQGIDVASAVDAVEKAYGREQGDEFIEPSVIAGAPALADGDAVFFFNFRADRARQLTNALTRVRPEMLGRELAELRAPALGALATLTLYDPAFGLPAAFGPVEVPCSLGKLVSTAGRRQLRIAETEKYAHVTYFFNGGREEPFPGEDRILVPSPRDVPTYDHKPEMSAIEVTDKLLEAIERTDYAFILLNYANPDMVGHTGIIPACLRAVEVIDACLDRVCGAVLARGGELLITSDHGNIEQLVDPETGAVHTAHTTNPVPIFWVRREVQGCSIRDGGLSDIAPSVCERLELEQPEGMTGRCLLRCDPPSSSS
jgi:2,3-bisphosphoglycerate-independent phosphoglycerate mutase